MGNQTLTDLGAKILTFLVKNIDCSEPGYSDVDAAHIGNALGESARSIARSITHISASLISAEGHQYSDNDAGRLDTRYYLEPAGWKWALESGAITVETYNRAAVASDCADWTPIATMAEGTRVQLTTNHTSAWIHEEVSAGAMGTIAYVDNEAGLIHVEMDRYIPGCEESGNVIVARPAVLSVSAGPAPAAPDVWACWDARRAAGLYNARLGW